MHSNRSAYVECRTHAFAHVGNEARERDGLVRGAGDSDLVSCPCHVALGTCYKGHCEEQDKHHLSPCRLSESHLAFGTKPFLTRHRKIISGEGVRFKRDDKRVLRQWDGLHSRDPTEHSMGVVRYSPRCMYYSHLCLAQLLFQHEHTPGCVRLTLNCTRSNTIRLAHTAGGGVDVEPIRQHPPSSFHVRMLLKWSQRRCTSSDRARPTCSIRK